MKGFKDFVDEDIDKVFFNTYEFGEVHAIAEIDCTIVFTNHQKAKADSSVNDNYINTENFSFLVKKEDIGFKPIVDNLIKFDAQMYTVINVIDNFKTYEVFLEANVR